MFKAKTSSAFSLIELSIVILVIGIIIAAIAQSRNLIYKSKVQAAAALTESSAVNSIKGLELWLETTLDKSITYNSAGQVVSWNDINPQQNNKNNAIAYTNSTATPRDMFSERDGANNLPSLYCPGSNAGFKLQDQIPLRNVDSTIFIVEHHQVIARDEAKLFYGDKVYYHNNDAFGSQSFGYTNNGQGLSHFHSPGAPGNWLTHMHMIRMDTNYNDVATSTRYTSRITTIPRSTQQASTKTMTQSRAPLIDFYLCYSPSHNDYSGYFSEFIVFTRALKKDEIAAVEDYLIKKYGLGTAEKLAVTY